MSSAPPASRDRQVTMTGMKPSTGAAPEQPFEYQHPYRLEEDEQLTQALLEIIDGLPEGYRVDEEGRIARDDPSLPPHPNLGGKAPQVAG